MIQNQSLSLTELGLLGIIKFIWIMGAGVLTGILCGILGSMLTKWCNKDYQNLGKAFTYYFISFWRHEPERWRIGGMMAASGRWRHRLYMQKQCNPIKKLWRTAFIPPLSLVAEQTSEKPFQRHAVAWKGFFPLFVKVVTFWSTTETLGHGENRTRGLFLPGRQLHH